MTLRHLDNPRSVLEDHLKRFWNRWLLCLTVTAPLCACGSGQPPSATDAVPAMPVLWSVSAPAFNHAELFGTLLVAGDVKTEQVTAVDVVQHKVAWVLPQKIETIGGTSFAHDDQFLYVFTKYVASGQPGLLVVSPSGQLVNGILVPERAKIQTTSGPRIVENRLYFTVINALYSYDRASLASGKPDPLWIAGVAYGEPIRSMAFDQAGNPYYSSGDAHLYALDPKTGKQRWAVDISHDNQTNLVSADGLLVSGNTLLALTGGGLLKAFDIATGAPKWNSQWLSYDTCSFGAAGFAEHLEVGGGKVFVSPDGGNCVSAFDLETGEPSWVFNSPNNLTFSSQPLYLNGVLYATNTRLWAIEATTGKALGVGKIINHTATSSKVLFNAVLNELYVWGDEAVAYRPMR
jgi:outer membrane protein assembly factor BamB